MTINRVRLALGEGFFLSIIQGEGVGSPERGLAEIAVIDPNGAKYIVEGPVFNLDAKQVADYIQTYIQDRHYERLFNDD